LDKKRRFSKKEEFLKISFSLERKIFVQKGRGESMETEKEKTFLETEVSKIDISIDSGKPYAVKAARTVWEKRYDLYIKSTTKS